MFGCSASKPATPSVQMLASQGRVSFWEPSAGFKPSYTTRNQHLIGFFPPKGDLVVACSSSESSFSALPQRVYAFVSEEREANGSSQCPKPHSFIRLHTTRPEAHWVKARLDVQPAQDGSSGVTHTVVVPRRRRSRAFPRGSLTRGRRPGQATLVTSNYNGVTMFLAVGSLCWVCPGASTSFIRDIDRPTFGVVVRVQVALVMEADTLVFPVLRSSSPTTTVTFSVINPKSMARVPKKRKARDAATRRGLTDGDDEAEVAGGMLALSTRPAKRPSRGLIGAIGASSDGSGSPGPVGVFPPHVAARAAPPTTSTAPASGDPTTAAHGQGSTSTVVDSGGGCGVSSDAEAASDDRVGDRIEPGKRTAMWGGRPYVPGIPGVVSLPPTLGSFRAQPFAYPSPVFFPLHTAPMFAPPWAAMGGLMATENALLALQQRQRHMQVAAASHRHPQHHFGSPWLSHHGANAVAGRAPLLSSNAVRPPEPVLTLSSSAHGGTSAMPVSHSSVNGGSLETTENRMAPEKPARLVSFTGGASPASGRHVENG